MSDRSNLSLLSDWLRHVDLRTQVFARPELCGAWRINTGVTQRCTFHALVHGRAWLHRRGRHPEAVQAGELVFVAPGHWHCLTSESVAPADDTAVEVPDATPSASAPVGLVCGWIDIDEASLRPFVSAVSEVTVLGARSDSPTASGLAALIQALAATEGEDADLLSRRLGELILLLVARQALSGAGANGLIGALRDPRLGAVLASVQSDPARSWTLESMARLAHMSRTAFALQFHCTVGETPASFVRRWRMLQARRLLKQGRLSVTQVAEACGYRSESAFRRAYGRDGQGLGS